MPPKCLIQFVKGRVEPTENAPLTNVEEGIPPQPAQISRRQAEPVRLLLDIQGGSGGSITEKGGHCCPP
jgi:hypothetical protein